MVNLDVYSWAWAGRAWDSLDATTKLFFLLLILLCSIFFIWINRSLWKKRIKKIKTLFDFSR